MKSSNGDMCGGKVVNRSLLQNMRRGTAESFVLHSAGFALLFLMHATVGRLLGPGEYGTFSFVLALTAALEVVAGLGWPTALLRLISQYREAKQWSLLKGAFVRAHQMILLAALLVSFILLGSSSHSTISPDLKLSFSFSALLLPVLCFVGLRRRALQALGRIKASIAFEEVCLPVAVIVPCLALGASTSSHALWSYFAGSSLVLIFGTGWLWKSLPKESRAAMPDYETRRWLAVALPIMFGGIMQMAMNRAGIIILGSVVDRKSVGLFSAAQRLANLLTFVLGAVNTIAAPMLAATYHGGRPQEFHLVLRKATLWSVAGSLPLFVVMLSWPQGLLAFFGNEFIEGAGLLRILAVGQFVNALTGPVGFALLMTDREKVYAWLTGALGFAHVVGNLGVIPVWGASGAAVVSSLTVIALNASMYGVIRWSFTREKR